MFVFLRRQSDDSPPVLLPGMNPYDMRIKCEKLTLCYDFSNADKFYNNATVQAEIGAKGSWSSCNMIVNKMFMGDWMHGFHDKVGKGLLLCTRPDGDGAAPTCCPISATLEQHRRGDGGRSTRGDGAARRRGGDGGRSTRGGGEEEGRRSTVAEMGDGARAGAGNRGGVARPPPP